MNSPRRTLIDNNGRAYRLEPGAKLDGLDLSSRTVSDVDLTGASLVGTKLRGTTLLNVRLDRANLRGIDAPLDMKACSFTDANLTGANLSWCRMEHCDFTRALLSKAKIPSSRLYETKFEDADLRDSIFSESTIERCVFSGATLDGTVFSASTLVEIDLSKVDCAKALLGGCTWRASTHKLPRWWTIGQNRWLTLHARAFLEYGEEMGVDSEVVTMLLREHSETRPAELRGLIYAAGRMRVL